MTAAHSTAAVASREDRQLVEALRNRDEAAFTALVRDYSPSMIRLAMVYVRSRAVAEEVVQETWLGVINGLGRFEGRSSLKTWVFRILTNTAKTRAEREGRSVPFSALVDQDVSPEPAVEPERFLDASHPRWAGHWASFPRSWGGVPEERLLARECRSRIESALEELPPVQKQVIALRDIEGWSSDEVCEALGLTDVNQRVLLHRARAKVQRALEDYLEA